MVRTRRFAGLSVAVVLCACERGEHAAVVPERANTATTATAATTTTSTATASSTPVASALPAANPPPRVATATSASASTSRSADVCTRDGDCAPRIVKWADGRPDSVIAQRCCLIPGGADGTRDHLGCQDANSKLTCSRPCKTASDCGPHFACRPWGNEGKQACEYVP